MIDCLTIVTKENRRFIKMKILMQYQKFERSFQFLRIDYWREYKKHNSKMCNEIRNERTLDNAIRMQKKKSNNWKCLLFRFLIFFNTFNEDDVNVHENFLWHKCVRVVNFSKKCVKNEKEFSPYPGFPFTYTFNISVTKCHVVAISILNFVAFFAIHSLIRKSLDKFPIVQIFNIYLDSDQ